ncbi:MAG: toll/interleukin-1 receptor domain-containing protein [Acidiferrobacterales bacterium]
MAAVEYLSRLKNGVDVWNTWREQNADLEVDLTSAELSKAELSGANLTRSNLAKVVLHKARLKKSNLCGTILRGAKLSRAILRKADLSLADLAGADLGMTDLRKANLHNAKLTRADLRGARLTGADLRGADLSRANLLGANLMEANLQGVTLSETILADTSLAGARGLDACLHRGPSTIDQRTLQRSGALPVGFLRGCGLPELMIEQLSTLIQPPQFYSCFISYASADEEFAQRLYADLQNGGVRCWFAREDMKIGDKILDTINEAIRLRDKVILILSRSSLESEWVEDEVTRAFAEERDRKETLLVPIRIDDVIMQTGEAWALKLRDNRHIGDFANWRGQDAYQQSLAKLLRDLRIDQAPG